MFANLVTLAIAVIALQMGIASYIDRRKSVEDQNKQLQELQANFRILAAGVRQNTVPHDSTTGRNATGDCRRHSTRFTGTG